MPIGGRQSRSWGMDLCWNDSETAESIKEANVICAHAIQEAKAICSVAIKEAETVCSAAIREAETQGASQAESLHRQHAEVIKHLEEQVIQEEGKSQIDFLSTCQAALNASPGGIQRCTGSFLPHIDGEGTFISPILLITRGFSYQATVCFSSSSCTGAWTPPRPKRWLPSPDPMDSMPLGGTMSKATAEGPPSSKQWEVPPWYKVLKQSCSEAFSQDTSLVRVARKEYFKKHSPFTTDGTCDLSEVFRHEAKSAKLLGLAIYKIQKVWEGPDELQQANYTLRALPKGLKFLQAVPPSESPKVMGLVPFPTSIVWPTAPGVGRRVRMREQLLITCRQYTTGLAWCATNVMITHQPHQTLSAAMTSKTVYPPEREGLMSQLCQSNHQQGTGRISLYSLGTWMEESKRTGFPWASLLGTTPTHWHSPGGDPDGEGTTHQPAMSHHLFSCTSWPGGCPLLMNYARHLPAVLDFISLRLH